MASLTLKGVPEGLLAELKREAAEHRRSLNGEVLHRLEQSVSTRSTHEVLEEIRRYRVHPRGRPLTVQELKSAIEEGRE
ncbi:MAG: FitA-like ribbon-helix-helix domain-containing protein [Gemmatimonadaceae bacterium]